MEQQLSTLIAMVQTVQEQQAGQQELSRSLQSDLEGLAVSQQEQVVLLEDFAHRQETRLEELVQRQNARCSELEQRQMETQATVENLHQDIRAMKEVFNSRIGATESGLEGLEITQQRLTTELQSAKTAMMGEMVTELKAHFATKDQLGITPSKTEVAHQLRPGAPEFLSSLCPPTGSSKEATASAGGGATALQCRNHPRLMDAPHGMPTNFNSRC